MARFDSYILCTNPRSGSTLLCRLLQATGVAGLPDSHFHRPSVAAWLADHGLAAKGHGAGLAPLRAALGAAIAAGTGGTGIFGLRLQGHSAPFFLGQLRLLHPEAPRDRERIEAAFGRTQFLYLHRQDKVAQAVSRLRAEQTGLWHRAADGQELERLSPPAPPRFDAAALARHVAEMTAADAAWDQWFTAEGLDPLRLDYDDLARDPAGTLARVLQELGLDPGAARGITPPTARLADGLNRDWALRFRTEVPGHA